MATPSQAEKHRIYIDATIPSYLVSNPSRVDKTAERQEITRAFWQDSRFEFILSKGNNGGTLMNDEILKECLEAKARLVALFGDLETYMEFMTKKQEKEMKEGKKNT